METGDRRQQTEPGLKNTENIYSQILTKRRVKIMSGKFRNITFLLLCSGIIYNCPEIKADQPDWSIEKIPGYHKETFVYKVVDHCEIRADVYRNPDEEVHPALIWIHGGALIFGNRSWLMTEQLEQYLQSGFTVISIDYRLAPETKLVKIIEDLRDAYTWIRLKGPDLFNVDPERVAVVGHSAGGYLTLMAGVCLDPKPKALISFYGYGNISGDWYARPDSFYSRGEVITREQAFSVITDSVISGTTAETQWKPRFNLFYIYCRQQGVWPQLVAGQDPKIEQEWFKYYEPSRMVTPDYPPTLLLHGEEDTDVPFGQSVLMSEVLKQNGVPFEFIRSTDWGHGFDGRGMKNPQVKNAFERIIAFLEKYVIDSE
jgi:acetyl esterase/lipase